MGLEIKGLLIDATPLLMEQLEESLKPDVVLEYFDFVNTVHKAIQYHMDADFNVCFIGQSFPSADLQSFFKDFKILGKKTPCAFVQVREKVDIDFDRSSLKSIGLDTVISINGDYRDKNALWDVLKDVINKRERDETISNLDSIVEALIGELDKTARERKRGAKNKLSNIYSKYIRESAQKFEGLTDEFFERLMDAVEDSEPFTASSIDVPEEILAKNLPHLMKDRYKGQSHRVWGKLLNKMGTGVAKEAATETVIEESPKVEESQSVDSDGSNTEDISAKDTAESTQD